jgi:hypothetical protein
VYLDNAFINATLDQTSSPSDKRFDNILYDLLGRYTISAGLHTITLSNAGTGSKSVVVDSVRVVGYCTDTVVPVTTNCPLGYTANTDKNASFATYSWVTPTWSDNNGIYRMNMMGGFILRPDDFF